MRLNRPTRRNRLKQNLAGGRHVLGASISISANPAVAILLASVEVDYLEIDLDDTAMSTEAIADIAVAGRAADLPTLIHPSAEYKGTYGPFLEAGVWGLSLDIDSVAEARQVVHSTRHAPVGNRGTFEPGPQNDYQEDPQDLSALNDEIHITARIGSVQGCLVASDIMAIHGIDAVEVDRLRLSKTLTGDVAELDRLEASVHGAAARHGKVISAPVRDERELRRLAALGVQMLRYRSDTEILADEFSRVVRHCVRAKEP